MSVVPLWSRKVRQARANGDRVSRTLAHQEIVINDRVREVNALATQTERAAVDLIRLGDGYLEAAAARRH